MNETVRTLQRDFDLALTGTQRVDPEPEGINESAFPPSDIEIEPYTTNVYNIIARIDHDEIDLTPSLERNPNLWSEVRQSQLIESLILKIPLPTFYFTSEPQTDGNGVVRTVWHVVDGLQRLCSIFNFVSANARKRLKLVGMEYLQKLNGLNFNELPPAYQRNIFEAQISAFVIRPGARDEVKFNIFKRINRGGVPLNQQEIRHALHQGKASEFLRQLTGLKSFKDATHRRFKSKRMVDREVVNRFLAFYLCRYDLSDYFSMDAFLNLALKKIDEMDACALSAIETIFDNTMTVIHKVLGIYAFKRMREEMDRPRSAVNKAIFEALSVVLAMRTDAEREIFANSSDALPLYKNLFLDKSPNGLEAVIGTSTGHRWNILRRSEIFRDYVESVLRARG